MLIITLFNVHTNTTTHIYILQLSEALANIGLLRVDCLMQTSHNPISLLSDYSAPIDDKTVLTAF